jgi:hypothetical protein
MIKQTTTIPDEPWKNFVAAAATLALIMLAAAVYVLVL